MLNLTDSKFQFSCAIRGFHVYRKFWSPVRGQVLDCHHEQDNVFDPYAIKVCDKESKEIVGHLPMEISRITKYILDRGAIVTAEVTSNHYRGSPLIQGGMEVPCRVDVNIHPTFNLRVLKSYEDLVRDRYVEPSNEKIIGTFISLASQPPNNSDRVPKKNSVVNTQKSAGKKKKNGSPSKKKEPSTKKSRDIRDMLKRYEKGPVPKHIPTPSTIIIDSD